MASPITLNGKAYTWSGFNVNQASSWMYSGDGVPTAFSFLTNKVDVRAKGGAAATVKWNLSIPYVAVEATACACPGGLLGTDRIRIEVETHPASTLAQRTDSLARLRALVLTTDFANSWLNFTQGASA